MKIIYIILLLSSYHSELVNVSNIEESKKVENEIKKINIEDQKANELKVKPLENTLNLKEIPNPIPVIIPEKKEEIKIPENINEKITNEVYSPQERQLYLKTRNIKKEDSPHFTKKERKLYKKMFKKIEKYQKMMKKRKHKKRSKSKKKRNRSLKKKNRRNKKRINRNLAVKKISRKNKKSKKKKKRKLWGFIKKIGCFFKGGCGTNGKPKPPRVWDRWTPLKNEFKKFIGQRNPDYRYFLFKKKDCTTHFCRNIYCLDGKDVMYENPVKYPEGENGWKLAHRTKKVYGRPLNEQPPNANQNLVNNLSPQESAIYNEYLRNVQTLKGDSLVKLYQKKCFDLCKQHVRGIVNTEYNKFMKERDARNKEKMFNAYYNNSIGCVELSTNPHRANNTKKYVCRRFWEYSSSRCNSKYGMAASMGCRFYDVYQEYPGGLSPADKEDLRYSIFIHSKKFFRKTNPSCNACGGKSNEYRTKYCNRLDFLRNDCLLKFGRQRAQCYVSMARKKIECSRNAVNGCYSVCHIRNKRYFLQRAYQNNHPKDFYCENAGQCQNECDRINKKDYYCDKQDNYCLNVYRPVCKRYCQRVVTQQVRLRKQAASGHDFKIVNFIARLKSSQIERIKFDNINEYQTRRMSELYNRDTLMDSILLMEEGIYLEQNEISKGNKNKRGSYEKELQDKIMLYYKDQKAFKKGKSELNVFDL